MSKFKVGDKVRVCVGHYGDNIPKGTTLNVVADFTLGAYWINTTEVEVSMLNAYSYEFKLVEGPEISNQTPSLVQKTTPKNDDNSEEDSLPADCCVSGNNAWFERGELPPIGTICEHGPTEYYGAWKEVEVLALREFKGHDTGMLVVFATEDDVSFPSGECFRPIKTAEEMEAEVVAEEREKIIEEMARVISSKVSDKRAAESLYELGYRKMEE